MIDSGNKYGVPHPGVDELQREHRPAPEGRVFDTRQEEAVRGLAGEVAKAKLLGYADPELEQVVTWSITLSNGLKLEVVDWAAKDIEQRGMLPYSEPLLRIIPEGGEPVDLEGPDVDVLQLVLKQVRPDHNELFGRGVHPAVRRKAMKVLKHHEDLPRPYKNQKP
jgi:hypothetical protein